MKDGEDKISNHDYKVNFIWLNDQSFCLGTIGKEEMPSAIDEDDPEKGKQKSSIKTESVNKVNKQAISIGGRVTVFRQEI